MPELAQILALALLPAIGNFCGALLAEVFPGSRKVLNWALHLAAGIVLAVVAVELLPTALESAPAWMVVGAFALGGAVSIALKTAIGAWQCRRGGARSAGAWAIYMAVVVDLLSDGLMIGAGSVVSFQLALVLALGQVSADVPEGFATVATFRERGTSRKRRMLVAVSLFLPVLGGALLGYFLLRDLDRAIQVSALAFTAGMLLLAAVEDILGEAHEAGEDSRASAVFLLGGFCLFMLVGSYFG